MLASIWIKFESQKWCFWFEHHDSGLILIDKSLASFQWFCNALVARHMMMRNYAPFVVIAQLPSFWILIHSPALCRQTRQHTKKSAVEMFTTKWWTPRMTCRKDKLIIIVVVLNNFFLRLLNIWFFFFVL